MGVIHSFLQTSSTPATISKQHCRMLQVERFFRQSRNILNRLKFVSTLSKGRNFTKNSFDIVAGVDGALRDDGSRELGFVAAGHCDNRF